MQIHQKKKLRCWKNSMAEVTALVLAAGLSRRMGSPNKMLLELEGKPLIAWVLERLRQSSPAEIIVVGSELSLPYLRRVVPTDLLLVDNPNYKTGMTSSIKVGTAAMKNHQHGIMVCLADQPLIQAATYQKLLQSFGQSSDEKVITVPFYEEKKGNPVIFSSHYRDQILLHSEPEGCKGIVQANRSHLQKVKVGDAAILMDIDTPEDYKQLIKSQNPDRE
jgi:molybdenum cofactor cytidylyltransferase